jgi:hypothetical protein
MKIVKDGKYVMGKIHFNPLLLRTTVWDQLDNIHQSTEHYISPTQKFHYRDSSQETIWTSERALGTQVFIDHVIFVMMKSQTMKWPKAEERNISELME